MKTISTEELKDVEEISRLCRNRYVPIMITRGGKADMVIMSVNTYRELLDNVGEADEWFELPDIDIMPNDPLGDCLLLKSIMHFATQTGTISTCAIQQKFGMGYARAAAAIDFLEEHEFISPLVGIRPRKILVTEDEFLRKFERIKKESK